MLALNFSDMISNIKTAINYWNRSSLTPLRQDYCHKSSSPYKVSKGAKIRNRYNQVPHLTQDTNGKVTNSQ